MKTLTSFAALLFVASVTAQNPNPRIGKWKLKQDAPPPDIFSLFKLSGFGVKDPRENPVQWDVSFEAKGDEYLGVLIRFMGDSAMPPEVDIC